ncbi:MAG: GspE/PulE family protein, partial [Patescibacteria group bacterium]
MPDEASMAIARLLLEKGKIPQDRVAEITPYLNQSPLELKRYLVGQRLTDEAMFTQAWAAVLGLPYADLTKRKIPKEILTIIPESTARGHLIVAVAQTDEALTVAMADPRDRQIVEFIHKKVNMPVQVALASENDIRRTLTQYQESLVSEFESLAKEAQQVVVEATAGRDLNKLAEDLPIVRTVDAILKHGILEKASDIHLEPTETQVIVRYRVDGILRDVLQLPKHALAGVVARIKVLSNLKIDEHRLPQDGRFKVESEDYKVAFRVSTLPVFDGEKVVMRLLDESGHGITLDQLGMLPRALEIFRRNIQKPHGMILVTGPTGSGKTTTLYAAMQELNTADVNISTIEDPIEYRMERINQTQVAPRIGLTFANGLRALVRQDPDIIMVGEIRDEETAGLAVNAALTGHLVLSTLHTNSAAGALPRLLDMKVEAFLVATTSNLLMAQRLVRKLCKECAVEGTMDEKMVESLRNLTDPERILRVLQREGIVEKGESWGSVPTWHAKGCE